MTRFTQAELDAIQAALEARDAIQRAIAAYAFAGFGDQVTQPLFIAIGQVNFSIQEVQS